MRQLGIALEFSAAYAPQRNGSAECSGKVLVAKARAIQINSNLPKQLWPEAMQAAGYLANCSPTRSLGWASLNEMLFKAVNLLHPHLYLGHVRVYGCQAYTHIPEVKQLRKEKLHKRALIGYLVSYYTTNIFRVWIPPKSSMISTRDVTFVELLFYHARDPRLRAPLPEHVEEVIKAISITEIPESTR
jgi:hypothetical protein